MSVPLLAGLCNAVITVLNLRGRTELIHAQVLMQGLASANLNKMMGISIVFLPLTWVVKSSVGYVGKLGPGASMLGAGSRLPEGL